MSVLKYFSKFTPPDEDYQNFRDIKNNILELRKMRPFLFPSTENLLKMLDGEDINMISKSGHNIVMAICLWDPTCSGIAKKMASYFRKKWDQHGFQRSLRKISPGICR